LNRKLYECGHIFPLRALKMYLSWPAAKSR
jgi:hypothetical protein